MYQFDGLLDEIKYSDVITIFRHVRPDCDAVGSQFGLKSWLNDNFPEKKVYALGNEYCQQGCVHCDQRRICIELLCDNCPNSVKSHSYSPLVLMCLRLYLEL